VFLTFPEELVFLFEPCDAEDLPEAAEPFDSLLLPEETVVLLPLVPELAPCFTLVEDLPADVREFEELLTPELLFLFPPDWLLTFELPPLRPLEGVFISLLLCWYRVEPSALRSGRE